MSEPHPITASDKTAGGGQSVSIVAGSLHEPPLRNPNRCDVQHVPGSHPFQGSNHVSTHPKPHEQNLHHQQFDHQLGDNDQTAQTLTLRLRRLRGVCGCGGVQIRPQPHRRGDRAPPRRGRHPAGSLDSSVGAVPAVVGARHAWHPSGATACFVMPSRSPLRPFHGTRRGRPCGMAGAGIRHGPNPHFRLDNFWRVSGGVQTTTTTTTVGAIHESPPNQSVQIQ